MRLSLLFLLCLASVCWCQEEPDAPEAKGAKGKWPPMPRLAVPDPDEDVPVSPLVDLRSHLQQLKGAREALSEDRAKAALYVQEALTPESQELSKLRLHLGSLLTRLGMQKPGPKGMPKPPAHKKPGAGEKEPPDAKKSEAPPPTDDTLAPPSKVVDPLALAQALFRSGNYDGALKAYKMISLEGMKAAERAPVQYMIATCLRKVGKLDEAAVLFREVANTRGDEELAVCAQWQLQALRWHKDMAEQLREIRARRKAVEEMLP